MKDGDEVALTISERVTQASVSHSIRLQPVFDNDLGDVMIKERATSQSAGRTAKPKPSVTMLVATTVLAAIVMSACSGAAESSSSTLAKTSQVASKPAIKIMAVGNYCDVSGLCNPEMEAAVQDRVSAQNAKGGINGHRIDLLSCSIGTDPNQPTNCANEAVSAGVVAIVSETSNEDDSSLYSILGAHHIPVIGPLMTQVAPYVSPMAYPATPGALVVASSTVAALKNAGAKNIVGVLSASQQGLATIVGAFKNAAKVDGVHYGGYVTIPAGSPDPSSQVAQAMSNGTDGIAFGVTDPTIIASFMIALKQQDYRGYAVALAQIATPKFLQSMGPRANGLLLTGFTSAAVHDSPAAAQYRAENTRYSPSSPVTDFGGAAWAAADLFISVAETLPNVTSAGLISALNGTKTDLGGLVPPIQFNTPIKALPFPRAFTGDVGLFVVENGAIHFEDPSKPFINAF